MLIMTRYVNRPIRFSKLFAAKNNSVPEKDYYGMIVSEPVKIGEDKEYQIMKNKKLNVLPGCKFRKLTYDF
jgi:hypothetical protein